MRFRTDRNKQLIDAKQALERIEHELRSNPSSKDLRKQYLDALDSFHTAQSAPETFYCPCCKKDEDWGDEYTIVAIQIVLKRDGHREVIDFNQPVELHYCEKAWSHLGLTEHVEAIRESGIAGHSSHILTFLSEVSTQRENEDLRHECEQLRRSYQELLETVKPNL